MAQWQNGQMTLNRSRHTVMWSDQLPEITAVVIEKNVSNIIPIFSVRNKYNWS